jgi:hypothetical protein
MLFRTSTKLLLLKSISLKHGLPEEISESVCQFLFMTHREALNRVRSQHMNVVNVIETACSRKNGFGGREMNDTTHEHWTFCAVEKSVEPGSPIARVSLFDASHCHVCGQYYCQWSTKNAEYLPSHILCSCPMMTLDE